MVVGEAVVAVFGSINPLMDEIKGKHNLDDELGLMPILVEEGTKARTKSFATIFKEHNMEKNLETAYDDVMLKESGLSRIFQHMNEHSIACISAFRYKRINCVSGMLDGKPCDGTPITKKENLERNNKLLAALLGLGFSVTAIDGTWIEGFGGEGAKEYDENTFFVVNKDDSVSFFADIVKLGEYFCQDSILFKHKENKNAYLYGTNNAKFPGYRKTMIQGHFHGGIKKEFMSKIKGRPFTFMETNDYNVYTRGAIFSRTVNEIFKNGPPVHFIENVSEDGKIKE